MHVAIYQTDERLLFTEIRSGNTEAFGYAFRKYAPRLEAFARKYTSDTKEAEDMVQEAFLKLWERRELLESVSLASFLFMLVRNNCLNYLKHQQVVGTVEQRLPDIEMAERLYMTDFAPDPSSLLMQKELSESVEQIMGELPPKCKEVFLLSRLKGLKNREIAVRLDISEKVVEKHIARALKRFREGLQRYALYLLVFMKLWQ